MADVPAPHRAPLLALGFVSLFVGVGAGLVRLGWAFPVAPRLVALHGALMVSGFFGTVIALERAVALGRRWAYAGPLASGLGALGLVAGAPLVVGQALLTAGAAALLAASLSVFLRQRALFTFTLLAGAACWAAGNALWLGGVPAQQVVPWWLGFLVLTIAGERLELSRFLRPSPISAPAFALVLATTLGGIVVSSIDPRAGALGFAAGLVALAAWLARFDIARRTVRERKLTRFIAVCLLVGYAWLVVGGAIIFAAGGLVAGTLGYDAAVHAITLGFVFSMVFGHAPIILPAVARVSLPYHPTFYVPLALLHASLVVRVAGDALARHDLRAAGGALDAVALLVFVASTIAAIFRGKLRGRGAALERHEAR